MTCATTLTVQGAAPTRVRPLCAPGLHAPRDALCRSAAASAMDLTPDCPISLFCAAPAWRSPLVPGLPRFSRPPTGNSVIGDQMDVGGVEHLNPRQRSSPDRSPGSPGLLHVCCNASGGYYFPRRHRPLEVPLGGCSGVGVAPMRAPAQSWAPDRTGNAGGLRGRGHSALRVIVAAIAHSVLPD